MKKTILLAAVLSVFTISATYAQSEAPAKKEKTEKTEKKKRDEKAQPTRGDNRNPMAELNLTEDQQAKMKVVSDESRAGSEAIRNDASLSDEQKREKMMEWRKTQNEKRNAILTPEQKKKWDEIMKERRGNGNWQQRGQ